MYCVAWRVALMVGVTMLRSRLSQAFACLMLLSGVGLQTATAQYAQTNLVSDTPFLAKFLDPNLSNPTGMAFNAASPFWVANQGSNVATLYNGQGVPQSLVVSVPGGPTGTVFNASGNNTDFRISDGSNSAAALFLFATGNQIRGWNPGVGGPPSPSTKTEVGFTSPTAGAFYTGLTFAIAGSAGATLYATDFRNAKIDPINGSFTPANLGGNFADPNLPAGYAPFNIQTIAGKLFVSYAKQDSTGTMPVAGVGNGFIDVFNLDGTAGLMNGNVRLVSNGPLNEPWGMTLASSTFGQFAGDLLVGNHGDGTIDAFDPITGLLLGMLKDAQGNPIVNQDLWALAFRNAPGFDPDGLYFTSSPTNPFGFAGGLFGEIQPSPLPGALPLFATGLGALSLLGWRRKRTQSAA